MEQLNLFRLFLGQDKGQKESTLHTNIKMVKKVLSSCNPLNHDTFKVYIQSLLDDKRSPSYIKQQVSVVKHWGECFSIQELKEYPYPKISYASDFVRATFEDEEIIAFLNAPNLHTTGFYAKRYEMWIVFFSILFYHGLRTIEIAKLQKNFIDFGRGVILIPASISKTSKTRMVPISPVVHENLKAYIQGIDGEYLFPSLHPSSKTPHVQCNDWQLFCRKQIARLGIARKNLTAYSGRHTYGSRQAEEDVSVFKIKEIMGHERVETTMKYVHIGLKALKKVQNSDRLARSTLSFAERFILFRSDVRKLLESYALSPDEEREMIKNLS